MGGNLASCNFNSAHRRYLFVLRDLVQLAHPFFSPLLLQELRMLSGMPDGGCIYAEPALVLYIPLNSY